MVVLHSDMKDRLLAELTYRSTTAVCKFCGKCTETLLKQKKRDELKDTEWRQKHCLRDIQSAMVPHNDALQSGTLLRFLSTTSTRQDPNYFERAKNVEHTKIACKKKLMMTLRADISCAGNSKYVIFLRS